MENWSLIEVKHIQDKYHKLPIVSSLTSRSSVACPSRRVAVFCLNHPAPETKSQYCNLALVLVEIRGPFLGVLPCKTNLGSSGC